jgi:serine protease Do
LPGGGASDDETPNLCVVMDAMDSRIIKSFVAGIVGAALGASAMIAVTSVHGGPVVSNVAVAAGEDDQQRIIEAVKHVGPSVVALEVTANGTQIVPNDPFGQFFGPNGQNGGQNFGQNFGQLFGQNFGSAFGGGGGGGGGGEREVPFQERASGSGFVYSRSGLILTNDHVVHGATKIEAVFANGDRVAGHVYSENPGADLALVQVDHYAKLPPPVEFGSSRAVEQGEWAIAIGEPLELKQTVTVGVVSGFNRDETIGGETTGQREFKGLLQTSAPINPGNSGGPLIDLDGRVIGVNQSVAMPAQDIGFAIPVDTVKTTVAALAQHPGIQTAAGSTGFIGVSLEPLDGNVRSQIGYQGQGVAIAGVVGGSPADRAGLEPGDVIQSVDGKAVTNPDDVASIVHKTKIGAALALRVWSGGNRKLVSVNVGTAPSQTG